MNLNKKNLDIAVLTSTEASRFTLNAILVSDEGTTVTDGHCLVHVSLPEQFALDSIPEMPGFTNVEKTGNFLLSRDAALEISKAIPKSKVLPILNNAFVGVPLKEGLASFMTTDLENPKVFTPRKPEGNFPDYERCVPKKEDARFAIGLNLDVIIPVLQQAKKFLNGERCPGVVLRFTKPSEAIRIDCACDGQTFTGIAMPLRVSDVDNVDYKPDTEILPTKSAEEQADQVLSEIGTLLNLPAAAIDGIKTLAAGRVAEVLRAA